MILGENQMSEKEIKLQESLENIRNVVANSSARLTELQRQLTNINLQLEESEKLTRDVLLETDAYETNVVDLTPEEELEVSESELEDYSDDEEERLEEMDKEGYNPTRMEDIKTKSKKDPWSD